MRDPLTLDQNPVVIDPANVDAVLDDRPTKPGNPLKPATDEVKDDQSDDQSDETDDQADEGDAHHEADDPRPLSRVIP